MNAVGPEQEPDEGGSRSTSQTTPPPRSLKSLAIRGSFWTLSSLVVSKALSAGSVLVLTYLLDPRAFGLMLIVNAVIQGLRMFSDVGIGPSVVQHERGDDRDFLNTAWTIQAVRGLCLTVAASIVAWPIALAYGNPAYLALIPVAAVSALLNGFVNTSYGTLHRHMILGPHAIYELGGQIVAAIVMLVIAYLTGSVWALVIGGIASSATQLVLSHTILARVTVRRGLVETAKNRFRWERDAVRELIRFGRWIFISTALTFLVMRGDKFVLAGFLSESLLGLYYVAGHIVGLGREPVGRMTSKVLFPIYARLVKEGPESLRPRMRQARVTLLWAVLPFFCVLIVWGQPLVDLLLDPRYRQAGWMLRIIAAGAIFATISRTCSPVLLAAGDSWRYMLVLVSRAIFLFAAMFLGGWYFGTEGLIVGIASVSLLNYPVLAWAVSKHGGWMPGLDLLAVIGCALFTAVGTLLTMVVYA